MLDYFLWALYQTASTLAILGIIYSVIETYIKHRQEAWLYTTTKTTWMDLGGWIILCIVGAVVGVPFFIYKVAWPWFRGTRVFNWVWYWLVT